MQTALPATGKFVSRFVLCSTCYFASYGVVFPTLFVANVVPGLGTIAYGLTDSARLRQRRVVQEMKSKPCFQKAAGQDAECREVNEEGVKSARRPESRSSAKLTVGRPCKAVRAFEPYDYSSNGCRTQNVILGQQKMRIDHGSAGCDCSKSEAIDGDQSYSRHPVSQGRGHSLERKEMLGIGGYGITNSACRVCDARTNCGRRRFLLTQPKCPRSSNGVVGANSPTSPDPLISYSIRQQYGSIPVSRDPQPKIR